jgi:hypothetical protein
MTPAQTEMKALVASLRDDLEALTRLEHKLGEVVTRMGEEPDPADVMAAAGYLHHIYTAVEAMGERILSRVDGALPSGERWHQEILGRLGLEMDGVRPAVLRPGTRAHLARLLRFRHFFRHAYRIDFLWAEVHPLVSEISVVISDTSADIEKFCEHLERSSV